MVLKFLDLKESRFHDVHGACDFVYQELHQQGIGTSVRHASVITAEEEEQLWSSGVIGIVNCLVNTKNVAALLWVPCVNCLAVMFIVPSLLLFLCVESSILLYCTVQYLYIAL